MLLIDHLIMRRNIIKRDIHFLHPGVVRKLDFRVRTTGISINDTYRRGATRLEDHPRDSGDYPRGSRRFTIMPSQDNGNMGKLIILPDGSILGYPTVLRVNTTVVWISNVCNADHHPLTKLHATC